MLFGALLAPAILAGGLLAGEMGGFEGSAAAGWAGAGGEGEGGSVVGVGFEAVLVPAPVRPDRRYARVVPAPVRVRVVEREPDVSVGESRAEAPDREVAGQEVADDEGVDVEPVTPAPVETQSGCPGEWADTWLWELCRDREQEAAAGESWVPGI